MFSVSEVSVIAKLRRWKLELLTSGAVTKRMQETMLEHPAILCSAVQCILEMFVRTS